MASAVVAVLPPPNVEEELVYRVFVYEPRYTDTIFPISYSIAIGISSNITSATY